ncbi:MAG: hypothetical protein JW809_15490 [Pirellulales bacterium]|nr:hypothetical protein [Pirellulales bacterium]
MRRAIPLLIILAAGCMVARASDDGEHWTKIATLAKNSTPEGAAELRQYLKSLTREQMLAAARQYSGTVANTLPERDWGPAVANIGLALAYYGDENGGLSDASLDRLLAFVADSEETAFFRFAMADVIGGEFGSHLTSEQTDRVLVAFTTALRDSQTPAMVRDKCCRSLRGMLQGGYRMVIYSDPAVREVRRTSMERWRDILSLIDRGEVALSAESREQLAVWRRRVHDFRKTLSDVSRNKQEATSLRTLAELCLQSTARLPLLNGDEAPKTDEPNSDAPQSGTREEKP